MFVAIPGSSSIGSVMLYMADIKAKKITEGTLLDYRLNDCNLIQEKGKVAPVSVWEIKDEDLGKYENICVKELAKRQVYVGRQKAWVYFKKLVR